MTCTSTTSETIARSCAIHEYSIDRFANDAYRILKQFNKSAAGSTVYTPALVNLGLGAGKFLDSVNTKSIADLFSKQVAKNETSSSTQWLDDEEEAEDNEDNDDVEEHEPDVVSSEKPSPPKQPVVQGDFFQKFKKSDPSTKVSSVVENKPTSSITSFFSRYSSNEARASSPSPSKCDDHYITCPKCSKAILAWEVAEHEDFHFARELQMEENRTNATVPMVSISSKSGKRKNDNPSTNTRTLDTFLNKKPKL